MKPMMIDFADARGAWRWDWRMRGTQLAVTMLALALVAGGAALWRGHQLRHELVQVQAAQARLQAAQQRTALAERDRARLGSEDEQLLRQSELQRALPWEAIFGAFERAPSARLESFEPDLARGVVKVTANMASVAALQDYLAALQASPVFLRVSLLRHEAQPEGAGLNFHYEAVLAGPYRLPDATPRSAP